MRSTTKKVPFLRALSDLQLLFSIDMNEADFIERGLIAWGKIGNKDLIPTLLKDVPVLAGRVDLPCDVHRIEYVVADDTNTCFDTARSLGREGTPFVESARLTTKSYLTPEKEYVKYALYETGAVSYIEVDERYANLSILYWALVLDDDGLPYITEKESLAITWYVAWAYANSKMWDHTDPNGKATAAQMMQYYAQEKDRHMRDARVMEYVSQNFIDALLNISVSHDKKRYNRSFKGYQAI